MKMIKRLTMFAVAASLLMSCGKGESTGETEVTDKNTPDTVVKIIKEEVSQKEATPQEDFSWLATSRVSKTDLDARGYAKEDYRRLRNAIFARHGYIFKSADLTEYFSKFSWYKPQFSDVTSKLSVIEQANVQTLQRLESGKKVSRKVAPDPGYDLPEDDLDNEYYWLSECKYSVSEFFDLAPNKATLRIWKNAIYARHGYIFQSADLRAHFGSYSWYHPYSKNVEGEMSAIERHNVKALKQAYDNW